MTEIRRDEPVSTTDISNEISFRNFHDRTIAAFQGCRVPDREPDFVSPYRSTYWHMGDHVIRSSDHWAGQNGCIGQATCIWTIDEPVSPGAWATGWSFYRAFRVRARVHLIAPALPADIEKARLIQARGAVPVAEWISIFGPGQIPPWAQRSFREAPGLSPRALQAFAARPALSHAVTAPERVLTRLLGDAPYVDLGYALDRPPM